jgi:hypothetical protein
LGILGLGFGKRPATTLTAPVDTAEPVRLPPFEAAEIDLGYILAG